MVNNYIVVGSVASPQKFELLSLLGDMEVRMMCRIDFAAKQQGDGTWHVVKNRYASHDMVFNKAVSVMRYFNMMRKDVGENSLHEVLQVG